MAAQQPTPSTLRLTAATFQADSHRVCLRKNDREKLKLHLHNSKEKYASFEETPLFFLLVMQFSAVAKIAEQGIIKREKGVILRYIFIQMLGIKIFELCCALLVLVFSLDQIFTAAFQCD